MIPLCSSARLVTNALKESPEPAFMLNSDGLVLYLNPPAKRLFFETTEHGYDRQAANPNYLYHYSFFWKFANPKVCWEDLVTESAASLESDGRMPEAMHCKTIDMDDGYFMVKLQDVVCKKTNDTDFVGLLRLNAIGSCACCEDVTAYLCAFMSVTDPKNPWKSNPEGEHDYRLKQIVDASFDPVFTVDDKGIILMTNFAAVKLFGWSKQELVGANIGIICGQDHARHHDKYMQDYLTTGVSKIIGTKREVPAKKRDGTEFPVELGIKEIKYNDRKGDHNRSMFVGFVKDLSTEKSHEKELESRAKMAQAMINSSFDPIIQVNQRGIIQMVNDATSSLFGWTREEMIDRNISMICSVEHADKHDMYMKRYLESSVKKIIGRKRRVHARRKDGTEFPIELGVSEAETETGEKMYCGYIRDLTMQLLDKQRLHDNDAILKGKFFGAEDGDTDSGAVSDDGGVPGRVYQRVRGRGHRRRQTPTL